MRKNEEMALKRLEQYQLTKLLWHGANAEVYLARDKKREQVVIKMLHASLSDHEAYQNNKRIFIEETNKLALLNHPHIVRIIETKFDQDIRPYFVMDYALGGTLRQKYPKGTRLSLETIYSYIDQLAAALVYAHDNKVIHCDVKPENVLLDKEEHLLLSDFGISRISESTLPQTTRDPFGTAVYMAPEQFKGKWYEATDQYALAIMIYEWFCGSPPFLGENQHQLMNLHMNEPVPSLREECTKRRDDISDETLRKVEPIVLKALAKEPDERFSSVQEFAQALKLVLPTPEPIPVPQTKGSSSKERVNIWKFGKQQMIACSAGLLISIVLAVLMPLAAAGSGIASVAIVVVGMTAILFIAAIAGPLAGLFTGSISFFVFFLITEYLFFRDSYSGLGYHFAGDFSNWVWWCDLGLALFGFACGFTYAKTYGQFRYFRSIAYVEGISIVVVVLLDLILISIYVIRYPPSQTTIMTMTLGIIAGSTLPSLILLLISLTVYGRFQKGVHRTVSSNSVKLSEHKGQHLAILGETLSKSNKMLALDDSLLRFLASWVPNGGGDQLKLILKGILTDSTAQFDSYIERAAILLPDLTGTYLRCWSHYQMPQESIDSMVFYIGNDRQMQRDKGGVAGASFQTHEILVGHMSKQANDQWICDQEHYVRFQGTRPFCPYTSFITVPIIGIRAATNRATCLGIICFDSKRSDSFDSKEIKTMLMMIARRVASALLISEKLL